jgi:hypothetical protein
MQYLELLNITNSQLSLNVHMLTSNSNFSVITNWIQIVYIYIYMDKLDLPP